MASLNLVTLPEVLKCEHPLVLVTQVPEPEADTGAVLGGASYHVTQHFGDVEPLFICVVGACAPGIFPS